MQRILILAPNWLGDAVMALPAIADVRRAYPPARITVVARPPVAPLFELVRDVDATRVLDTHSIGDTGDEVAILLPNSFNAALAAYRSGIPERWGYRADWRAPLLTRGVPRPRGLHQVAYYQHLVAALGIANGPAQPRIDASETMVARGRTILREAGWDGSRPVVALAPGAAYGGAKRWPPELFGGLARRFASEGLTPVVAGSAGDASAGRSVVDAARPAVVIDLIGRTTLVELAAVFSVCRSVVSNDSGAMHLAAALGVPLTAIFGPTNDTATAPNPSRRLEAPLKGAPYASAGSFVPSPQLPASSLRSTVLVHPVWCRPCMLRECPLDHACMRGITVDDVHRATLEATR